MTAHILMKLPYDENALSPYITAETISYHYDKHHRTYLNNLNNLIAGSKSESLSLKDIVIQSHKNSEMSIFNNAAQVLNHDFYWLSMTPNGGMQTLNGQLKELIENDFKDLQTFQETFIKMGLSQFGSGWVWLVQDNTSKKLLITTTSNAANPILNHQTPLLTCDVWEHAYYIDYRNKRAEYLEIFLNKLVNWQFASNNLIK